jgi:hypothetical protein
MSCSYGEVPQLGSTVQVYSIDLRRRISERTSVSVVGDLAPAAAASTYLLVLGNVIDWSVCNGRGSINKLEIIITRLPAETNWTSTLPTLFLESRRFPNNPFFSNFTRDSPERLTVVCSEQRPAHAHGATSKHIERLLHSNRAGNPSEGPDRLRQRPCFMQRQQCVPACQRPNPSATQLYCIAHHQTIPRSSLRRPQ